MSNTSRLGDELLSINDAASLSGHSIATYRWYRATGTGPKSWLRGVRGYLDEETGAVADWPIFVFVRGERTVRVCVASVHVAPAAATD